MNKQCVVFISVDFTMFDLNVAVKTCRFLQVEGHWGQPPLVTVEPNTFGTCHLLCS